MQIDLSQAEAGLLRHAVRHLSESNGQTLAMASGTDADLLSNAERRAALAEQEKLERLHRRLEG
jgi:hypothetical protein